MTRGCGNTAGATPRRTPLRAATHATGPGTTPMRARTSRTRTYYNPYTGWSTLDQQIYRPWNTPTRPIATICLDLADVARVGSQHPRPGHLAGPHLFSLHVVQQLLIDTPIRRQRGAQVQVTVEPGRRRHPFFQQPRVVEDFRIDLHESIVQRQGRHQVPVVSRPEQFRNAAALRQYRRDIDDLIGVLGTLPVAPSEGVGNLLPRHAASRAGRNVVAAVPSGGAEKGNKKRMGDARE